MKVHAFAKVNLGLDVLNKRPDGYHEIRSLFQTIDLHDDIEILDCDSLTLECDDPRIPPGRDNLVMKAAEALREATGFRGGARLILQKRIPSQAGLGGGSSDAAATLLGLARHWDMAVSFEDLRAVAASLGSDVPFFLFGGTALGIGRGEEIYPLPDAPARRLMVVMPPEGVSTSDAYRRVSSRLTGSGGSPRIAALVHRLIEGTLSPRDYFNLFEEVLTDDNEETGSIRKSLLACRPERALLAGSGAAWVCFLRDADAALDAGKRMASLEVPFLPAATLTRQRYWELGFPPETQEILP